MLAGPACALEYPYHLASGNHGAVETFAHPFRERQRTRAGVAQYQQHPTAERREDHTEMSEQAPRRGIVTSKENMDHLIHPRYDNDIVLHDDTEENRQRVLLGQPVKIMTTHAEDPFVDEMCFVKFERCNIPWADPESISVCCTSTASKKMLLLYVDINELTQVAAKSARNTTQLTAMLGYATTYTKDPTSKHYQKENTEESEDADEGDDSATISEEEYLRDIKAKVRNTIAVDVEVMVKELESGSFKVPRMTACGGHLSIVDSIQRIVGYTDRSDASVVWQAIRNRLSETEISMYPQHTFPNTYGRGVHRTPTATISQLCHILAKVKCPVGAALRHATSCSQIHTQTELNTADSEEYTAARELA